MNTYSLTKPKVILFDWDNTLISSWGAIHSSLSSTMKRFANQDISMADTKVLAQKAMRDYFPDLFGNEAPEAAKYFQGHYREYGHQAITLMPGAPELLANLQNSSILCGVVSNKNGVSLRKEIANYGWNDYFQVVIGSGDTEFDKPSPKPILAAIANLGNNPGKHVWYVGDAPTDLEAATKAGVTVVLISELELSPLVLAEFPPHLQVPDLMRLADITKGFFEYEI